MKSIKFQLNEREKLQADIENYKKLYRFGGLRTSLPIGTHPCKVTSWELGFSTKNPDIMFIIYHITVDGKAGKVIGDDSYVASDTFTVLVEQPEDRAPENETEERYKNKVSGLYTPFQQVSIVPSEGIKRPEKKTLETAEITP